VRAARAAIAAIALAWAVAAMAPAPAPGADSRPITVLLIRHAEKNEHPPGGDAGLATAGLVRAQTLVRTLKDAGVTAIYASKYPRARLTAEPLAQALGDTVRVYDPNDLPALARRIRDEDAGRTVLVVGHGDSVPAAIMELGGPALAKGEGVGYDRLFVLTIEEGRPSRLLRLAYGDAPR
jgi:broad specificity phosphatase PhoE